MEDKQLQKNEFVREKIKDKPKNKPKNHKCLFVKICSAALSGVVFALAAILVLFMLFPLVEKRMEAEVVPGTIDSSHPQKETQTQSTESEAETQKETPVVKSEISLEDYQKIQTELYAIGNRANKSIVTITFGKECKGYLSLFAVGGEVSGVTLTGLKYPTKDAVLTSDFPLGVSNEFTGVPASISFSKGTLLVVYPESAAVRKEE